MIDKPTILDPNVEPEGYKPPNQPKAPNVEPEGTGPKYRLHILHGAHIQAHSSSSPGRKEGD